MRPYNGWWRGSSTPRRWIDQIRHPARPSPAPQPDRSDRQAGASVQQAPARGGL